MANYAFIQYLCNTFWVHETIQNDVPVHVQYKVESNVHDIIRLVYILVEVGVAIRHASRQLPDNMNTKV